MSARRRRQLQNICHAAIEFANCSRVGCRYKHTFLESDMLEALVDGALISRCVWGVAVDLKYNSTSQRDP